MAETFQERYESLSKEVFLERARQQVTLGNSALDSAGEYANKGKPDFTLAYLLLADASDEVKIELFARAYEQRASLSEKKAHEYTSQYHRPFPLITVEAQKDRLAARQIRLGQRLRHENRSISIN